MQEGEGEGPVSKSSQERGSWVHAQGSERRRRFWNILSLPSQESSFPEHIWPWAWVGPKQVCLVGSSSAQRITNS